MTKVNYLRLLIFGCMIALAVGEATKINADRGNNSKEESELATSLPVIESYLETLF